MCHYYHDGRLTCIDSRTVLSHSKLVIHWMSVVVQDETRRSREFPFVPPLSMKRIPRSSLIHTFPSRYALPRPYLDARCPRPRHPLIEHLVFLVNSSPHLLGFHAMSASLSSCLELVTRTVELRAARRVSPRDSLAEA